MKSILPVAIAGALTAGFGPAAAFAQDSAVRLTVELEILPGCTFSSGGGDGGLPDAVINFGGVGADGEGDTDAMAASAGGAPAFSLVCSDSYTGDAAPTLTLDAGLNAAGGQRYMRGPNGATAAYALYQDQQRSRPYDPTSAVQLPVPTPGAAIPINVFGRVADVSGLPDGHYADVVTLTLSY